MNALAVEMSKLRTMNAAFDDAVKATLARDDAGYHAAMKRFRAAKDNEAAGYVARQGVGQ